MTKSNRVIRPQPWYQEKALSCPADIVFWWGSAGAWKTFELLLEPMKWFDIAWFRWVIFRRTMPQIKWGWWLWDESVDIYKYLSGWKSIEWLAKWVFKRKHFWLRETSELKFAHLEYEKDVKSHQWLQYAFIGFDELTHFTMKQFLYLVTRLRSTCWIKPFMRCTCNPDPESWVAEFIKWYLDEDGYIIKDRDWVIRYFTIDKWNVIWGNNSQEVIDQLPHVFDPLIEAWEDIHWLIKSFTFIEWSLDENKELLAKDPTYKGNLMAQDEETKKALLDRCWKAVQDDLAIVDYGALEWITSNYLEPSNDICYSLDVAGFWKDLAVGKVWKGWDIVKINIQTKSTPEWLHAMVESDRKEFRIPKRNVVYDNDWMGWALAWKDYTSFWGNDPVIPENWVKDNYKNLKTQCYYRMIEQIINKDKMHITQTEIYVDWVKQDWVIVNWEKQKVVDLFKADIKSVKRAKIDQEWKRQIIPKSEQKVILKWRSPDFWDTASMRYIFELKKKKKLYIW